MPKFQICWGAEARNFQKFISTIPYWQREKDQRCIMLLPNVRGFSCVIKIRGFLILQVRKLRFHMAEFLVGSHTNLNK